MSVLIKGMEMPTSCSECGQFRWNNYLQNDVCRIAEAVGDVGIFQSEDEGIDNRPDWCPLIPVPPHGDLIDRDALTFSRIRIAHPDGIIGGYNAVVMSAEINNAPTIIPAEEATQ